jgi:L-ascorbate metabolism protein UlaG (beta-lactamase superfamily)
VREYRWAASEALPGARLRRRRGIQRSMLPPSLRGLLSAHVGTPPEPTWYHPSPRFGTRGIALRYLGTAGFVLRTPARTLVLDPYLTRASLSTVFGQRLVPNASAVQRHVPEADDVLVGHAHYDHVLDAPTLCLQTGARLIGSRAVCNVGLSAGVPASQRVETSGREDIPCGDVRVRGLPSRHGKVFLGRVLFPGDIPVPPPWPARVHELRHGPVLNWLLQCGDFSMLHIDSADFLAEELSGVRADVLCLCAAGRKYRPRYVEEAIRLLRPRYVVPCHWDTMCSTADAPLRMLPGIDLGGMVEEIRRGGSEPVLLPMQGSAHF